MARDGTPMSQPSHPNATLVVQLGHTGHVRCAQLSPDRLLAITGDGDGVAILWHISGRELRRFVVPHRSIAAACVSKDATLVALAYGEVRNAQDTCASVWNAATGELMHQFAGHAGSVDHVAISPDS